MYRKIALTLACFVPALVFAQTPPPQVIDIGAVPTSVPAAEVGTAYNHSLFEFFGDALQQLEGFFSLSCTASEQFAPGLSVNGAGRVTGTPTQPGSFPFRAPCRLAYSDAQISVTVTFTFTGNLQVTGTAGGLSVEGGGVSFSFPQGSQQSQTQSIKLVNKGSAARSFSVSATTSIGRGWLSASSAGRVGAFGSAPVTITASPSGLPAGVYTGTVTIRATGGANQNDEEFNIAAVMTITAAQQTLSLSQSGMTFEVVQGSPARLTQTFQVSNSGGGTLQYSTAVTTITGGRWLTVSSAAGEVTPTAPDTLTITASAAGLTPGQYHGQVEVRADRAANSPRYVNVVLNVLPANSNVAPAVVPTGVVLVQRAGAAVAAQSVILNNVTDRSVTFQLGSSFETATTNWFRASATSTSIAAGQTATVSITRNTAVRMPAGVHRGELTIRFGALSRRVTVVLIVLPGAENLSSADKDSGAIAADGCTPTQLVPVFTTLGTGFSITAAWPNAIEMLIVDDCGDPMLRGLVSVSFSNGDPPLVLAPAAAGRWGGTWQPKAPATNVTLTATAQTTEAPLLSGTAQIGGAAASNPTTPVITSGGVLSAASYVPQAPLAPGSYIAIFGKAMASGLTVSQSLPLPADLGGTQAILGGRRLGLQFAADGQINAVVPYDVPANTTQQLIVRRGNALSTPESVVIATAQPAPFTKDLSGKGESIVLVARPDGTQFLVTKDQRAAAGDVLIIYCAGLGPVDQTIAAGAASPSNPPARTVNAVTVSIGGRNANVLFAGLTPTLAGLYQINAVMPEGVAAGPDVPLTISVAGQTSGPGVTIAVR